jgi:hypothetical protein
MNENWVWAILIVAVCAMCAVGMASVGDDEGEIVIDCDTIDCMLDDDSRWPFTIDENKRIMFKAFEPDIDTCPYCLKTVDLNAHYYEVVSGDIRWRTCINELIRFYSRNMDGDYIKDDR